MGLLALVSASCSSQRGPSDADLRARFEQLHRRLYEVYELGDDRDALWSFLAASFDGEELTAEYLEHFTASRRMARERTEIRVLEVDYEQVTVRRDRKQWWVDADWSVGGVVRHQSHRHPRINRYRATYELAHAGGARDESLDSLRIVGTTLRSLERVGTSRSSGFPLDDAPSSARGSLSLSDLLRSGAVEAKPAPERPSASDGEPPSRGRPVPNPH